MECFSDGGEFEVFQVVFVYKFLYAQAQVVFLPAKRHFAVTDEFIAADEEGFHDMVGSFSCGAFLAFDCKALQQGKILPEQRFMALAFDYRADFLVQKLSLFKPLEMQPADADEAGGKIIAFLVKEAMQHIRADKDDITAFDGVGTVFYGAAVRTCLHEKNFRDIRMRMQGLGADELLLADFLQIDQTRLRIQFKDIICRFGKGVLRHLGSSDSWDKFLKIIINHNKEQNLKVFMINYIKNEQDFKGLILKIHYNEYYKMIF